MNLQISAIIPAYNRARMTVRALESVLAQTCPVHEVIVVDDGSTDDTSSALRPYVEGGQKESPPVRYIYQQNQRQSAARNRGIEEAKGEWVAFLDSDDIWYPQKLELQCQSVAKFWPRASACFTDAMLVNHPVVKSTVFQRAGKSYESNLGLVESASQFVARGNHGFQVQTLMARTELVRSVGGFDRGLFLHEDTDLIFRLAMETNLCFVNSPLVDIDRTPNRPVGMVELLDQDEVRLQQRQFMYEKWLRLSRLKKDPVSGLVADHLASIHSEWANVHLARGDTKKAQGSMTDALKYSRRLKKLGKWLLMQISPSVSRRMVLKRASETMKANSGINW